MKSVARFIACCCITTLFFGCDIEKTSAPDPAIAFHRRGHEGDAVCRISRRDRGHRKDPVELICTIEVPGNPLLSTGKSWVDQRTGTYYLADRSNAGLHVIDIERHKWVGLIPGFEGADGANGVGPSSITEGRRRRLWVSDGNSMVRLVDQRRRRVVASVSTAIDECGDACDRTNEIAYDSRHDIVLVSNPSPDGTDGYLTFISGRYPYGILGHLSLGPGTLEGHIWVPQLNRFLVPMQNPPGRPPFIAVVNPKTREVEDEREYDCAAIPGTFNTGGNNNLMLGLRNHLLAQICGVPIIMDVRTGDILNVVTEIGTGDQDWYNPGDQNFYVFGQAPPGAGAATQSLGVIDARRATWLQNVPLFRGAYPAAWARTNEIFARITVTAAMVADPTTDDTACEVKGRGCVVVFAHADDDDGRKHHHH